jgi:uncharacterized protein DUF6541
MIRSAALAASALVALGFARLLPDHGLGLGLRLAAATAVLLVPGVLIARALRSPGAAGALVWTLTALTAGLMLVFAAHWSLDATLVVLALAALAALPFAKERSRGSGPVVAAGVIFGILLWRLAPDVVAGDVPFHLARIRKLEAFGSLSLRSLDEFRDGGLHPGYAFPLWHAFLALVARLSGADPVQVVKHEPSVLAPLAFLIPYEAGVALFRSRPLGVAVSAATVSLLSLAPAHGGIFRTLALPSSAAQVLLVPAALALAFRAARSPSIAAYASLAAASLVLALVHPTYAFFLLLPVFGWLVARAVLARKDVRPVAYAVGALAVPAGLVALWLLPIARETVSHDATARTLTSSRHGFRQFPRQIDVFSEHSFRLAPGVIDRRGAIAVAALALVPLAALTPRRRWAAFVLGGTLAVLAVLLIPELFVRLSDQVSLSQARRAASFVPIPFALAGGASVLARPLGWWVAGIGLAGGIGLQLAYPGDFGYTLRSGGPALVVWFAAFAGAAALVAAALLHIRVERPGVIAAVAVVLFCVPAAVSGFVHWTPQRQPSTQALPSGLLTALRRDVPDRSIVFSDPATSYLVAAAMPVYIASAPPAHVADTKPNRPAARVRDAMRFLRTGAMSIPRRYDAGFVLLDRRRTRLRLRLPRLYSDSRYTLYRAVYDQAP